MSMIGFVEKNGKLDILCVIGGNWKLYDKVELLVTKSMNRLGSREMVNFAIGCGSLGFLTGAKESGIFPKHRLAGLYSQPGDNTKTQRILVFWT